MCKKAKKSPPKSAKLDTPIKKPKVSHTSLNKRFHDVGEKLAELPVGEDLPELKAGKGYREDKLEKVLSDEVLAKSAPAFGRAFRDVQPNMDEIVSTASFRELSRGMLLGKKKMPADKRKRLRRSLNEVSKLRLPTASSGMATKERTFQHPTNEEEAVFAANSGSGKTHAELDLRRRAEVVEGMERALAMPGATANSVLREGMSSAIGFELNEFTGPASATSMDGRTREKAVKRRREQTAERDHLKPIHRAYGGKQEAGAADLTRAFQPRAKRESSPPRFDDLPGTESVSLLSLPKAPSSSLGAAMPKSKLLDPMDVAGTTMGAKPKASKVLDTMPV